MFSVNLTTTALHDEHFIKFVESVPGEIVAAEGDDRLRSRYAPTAVKLADKMPEVARGPASPRLPLGAR